MSAETTTVQVNCPRDTDDAEDCEGVVTVTLEYEPGDNRYGADADGNRGIRVAGYWSGTSADACSLGHTLTTAEQEDLQNEAEQTESPEPDEYWGPEPDDDR